jgi:hypothetical protein
VYWRRSHRTKCNKKDEKTPTARFVVDFDERRHRHKKRNKKTLQMDAINGAKIAF